MGDIYNVKIEQNYYKCLMLSDNVKRTTGLKENIHTDEPKQSVTEFKYASPTDKLEIQSRNATIKVDKANASIEQIVSAVGDNGQVTSASIIQSINNDTSSIKLEADKIDLNGAVTANNNFIINQDGSVEVNSGYITLTDNPSDPEDRFIIWASDKTSLTTATSEYVLVRTYDENNPQSLTFDYTEITKDGGVSWTSGYYFGHGYYDMLLLQKTENGVTTRSQYRSDGATINGAISGGIKATSSNGDSSSSNYNKWHHIGKLKFNQHFQGEFAHLKIYIGDGNNGRYNQQAFIDLYMQLGWTGDNNGRLGCTALLHPLHTSFRTSNTSIKVMAVSGSNTQYDIYILTSKEFVVPNVSIDMTTNASFTNYDEYISGNPTGDECNLMMTDCFDGIQ